MDTRTRILDAALDCFLELGYEQTTVALIRERSGVSNGALFHYFPTKDAIADALYIDAISSFQEGLWDVLRRKPRSLRAAVRGVIQHQINWIEANVDRARFVYIRGTLEGDSAARAQLEAQNRKLAVAYQDWMRPLVQRGLVRPMPMLVVNAIVTGPTHAISRRWLAGQLRAPLHTYLEHLAEAACAALSSTAGPARMPRQPIAHQGRLRLELVSDDGHVIGKGEATAEIVQFSASSPEREVGIRRSVQER